MQRQVLQVQLPTLRASLRLMRFHQNSETSGSPAQGAGSETDSLYRRHPDDSRDARAHHTMGLIFLLENLGFIIGYKKCVLTPTQLLGFTSTIQDSQWRR